MIDLSRATVLPGLIDSHTHLFLIGESGGRDDEQPRKESWQYRTVEVCSVSSYNTSPMEERDFFDESELLKPATLSCLHCRQTDTYEIRWLVRTRKKNLRGPVDDVTRARFVKARSYMLRRDDFVQCKNPRCRKRFEISGVQSVVFI